jgi:hypothetical protein
LPVLFCLGGVMILIGISLAVQYASLPHFQKRMNKMPPKNKKDK